MLPRFTPRIWRCTDQRVRVQEPWQTTQTLGLQHWKLLWFTRHGLSGCASIPSMPRVGIRGAGTQSYTKRSNSKNLSRRNEKIQLKLCRRTHPKSFRKMDDKIIGRRIAQQPSPDDFEVMREGLFISKPEQLQQSPLLTEDEGSYCKDENQQKWARRRGCGRICSTCAAITLCFEEGTGLVDTNG